MYLKSLSKVFIQQTARMAMTSNVQVKLLEEVERLEQLVAILRSKQADLIRREDEMLEERKRVALDFMLDVKRNYRALIERAIWFEKQAGGEIEFSLASYLFYWQVLLMQHVMFVSF